MGFVHDQKFYAVRFRPGSPLPLPELVPPFTALVDARLPASDAVLSELAMTLLRAGCVHVVARGRKATRFVDLFDALVDEHGFSYRDRTVAALAMEDDSLADAIGYFILPTGLATTGVIVTVGDGADVREAVREFAYAAGDLRERIHVPAHTDIESVVRYD